MSSNNPTITIQNKTKQQVSIQVKPPNGDFFIEERQIRLSPVGKKGSIYVIAKNFLNLSQIQNYKAKGIVSIAENK